MAEPFERCPGPLVAMAIVALVAGGAGGREQHEETPPEGQAAVEEELTVVARRRSESWLETPGAVSLLEEEALRTSPAADLAGALAALPGLQLYDVGGTPAEPAVNVRGFTGGGENDYLLVLVDGVPINDLGTGRVDWRELALAEVERVEVLRGPLSSLYGDAALGGVVQIFTHRSKERSFGAELQWGTDAELGAGLSIAGALGTLRHRLSAAGSQGDGWRRRSAFEDRQLGLRLEGGGGERSWLLDARHRMDDHERPGPLPPALLEEDPTVAAYPFDEVDRRRTALSLGEQRRAGAWSLESRLSARLQDDRSVETLLIETKERRFSGPVVRGEVRASRVLGWRVAGPATVALGLEGVAGEYESRYFEILSNGSRGGLSADGEGERRLLGLFADLELRPTDNLGLSLGLRHDAVRDRFDERLLPDASAAADNEAWSPRLALVWQLSSDQGLFATAGGAFKAPTPFQLFDQRRPFGIPITNPGLEPTRGRSYGAGYRRTTSGGGGLEVTAYWLDLEDEIGFDPVSFRTDNIGRSRHRGVELDARLAPAGPWGIRLSYTFTDARFRVGELDGRRIDNVPRHAASLVVSYGGEVWSAGLALRSVADTYLDPLESVPLQDYTTVGLTLWRRLSRFEVGLRISNVGDRLYSSWGFVSPLDGGPLLYPGAGRRALLSIRYRSQ